MSHSVLYAERRATMPRPSKTKAREDFAQAFAGILSQIDLRPIAQALQTVPTPPLLWWGVRVTLPCKPRLNEEPRCGNEKASLRTLHIRT